MKHFPLCCWHFDMSEASGKVSSIVITIYRDYFCCLGIVEFFPLKNHAVSVSVHNVFFFKGFPWWKSCYSFGFRLRIRDDDLSHHEEKSCHLDFVIDLLLYCNDRNTPFLAKFWPLQHTLRQNNFFSFVKIGKKIVKREWFSLNSHYSKSQIFVQKFNFVNPQHFHEFFPQIFFDNFSREIKVVNS